MNGVRIAASHVGQGVFATQSFKRYETIGEVQGRRIDDPAYSSEYCIGLNAKQSLEPEAPFRYLNHSCQPNCRLVSDADRLWVEAVRAITPGQELTIDYAWDAESAVPCACGAVACRGWIVDKKELWRLPA
jgi:uncharacterized protein